MLRKWGGKNKISSLTLSASEGITGVLVVGHSTSKDSVIPSLAHRVSDATLYLLGYGFCQNVSPLRFSGGVVSTATSPLTVHWQARRISSSLPMFANGCSTAKLSFSMSPLELRFSLPCLTSTRQVAQSPWPMQLNGGNDGCILMPAFLASSRRLEPAGTSISFFSLTNVIFGIGGVLQEVRVEVRSIGETAARIVKLIRGRGFRSGGFQPPLLPHVAAGSRHYEARVYMIRLA